MNTNHNQNRQGPRIKLPPEKNLIENLWQYPITKGIVIAAGTIGLLYLSSWLLDSAGKAVRSYNNFTNAMKGM